VRSLNALPIRGWKPIVVETSEADLWGANAGAWNTRQLEVGRLSYESIQQIERIIRKAKGRDLVLSELSRGSWRPENAAAEVQARWDQRRMERATAPAAGAFRAPKRL